MRMRKHHHNKTALRPAARCCSSEAHPRLSRANAGRLGDVPEPSNFHVLLVWWCCAALCVCACVIRWISCLHFPLEGGKACARLTQPTTWSAYVFQLLARFTYGRISHTDGHTNLILWYSIMCTRLLPKFRIEIAECRIERLHFIAYFISLLI